MEEQDESWLVVALVLRVAPDVVKDLQEIVVGIPGVFVVHRRISRQRLFISERDPRGGK